MARYRVPKTLHTESTTQSPSSSGTGGARFTGSAKQQLLRGLLGGASADIYGSRMDTRTVAKRNLPILDRRSDLRSLLGMALREEDQAADNAIRGGGQGGMLRDQLQPKEVRRVGLKGRSPFAMNDATLEDIQAAEEQTAKSGDIITSNWLKGLRLQKQFGWGRRSPTGL